MANKKHKLTIAVLMGGVSSEHDISLETGKNIVENLDRSKYYLRPVEITKNNRWRASGKYLPFKKALKGVDLVFNALHGTFGEDGKIQGLLEILRIPYTGSGVLASALAMDKLKSKIIFKAEGLNVAKF